MTTALISSLIALSILLIGVGLYKARRFLFGLKNNDYINTQNELADKQDDKEKEIEKTKQDIKDSKDGQAGLTPDEVEDYWKDKQ